VIRLFKLAFSLVLLLVLLVVADRLAARVAGQVVADRIKASQHLTTTPKVTIEGFPFLTQLWHGDYGQVDATAQDIARDDVRATSLTLHLHGVHVKIGDVMSQSVKAIPVDHADGTVTLSYADVNALVKTAGITVDAAANGQVKVIGTVEVLGHKVKASGLGSLAADPAGIKVTVSQVKAAGLTPTITSLLVQKLSFVIPTTSLPYAPTVEAVSADSTGVTVTADLAAFSIPVQ
jgi:hypothetical protein